jgi:hypothetical protein
MAMAHFDFQKPTWGNPTHVNKKDTTRQNFVQLQGYLQAALDQVGELLSFITQDENSEYSHRFKDWKTKNDNLRPSNVRMAVWKNRMAALYKEKMEEEWNWVNVRTSMLLGYLPDLKDALSTLVPTHVRTLPKDQD